MSALLIVSAASAAYSATPKEIEKAKQDRLALQASLDKAVAAYEASQDKLAETQQTLEENQKQLAGAEADLRKARKRVAVRANLTYREGSTNIVEFLLSARSFGDFTRKLALIEKISGEDAIHIEAADQARLRTEQLQEELSRQNDTEKQLMGEVSSRTRSITGNFDKARALEKKLLADRETALALEGEKQRRILTAAKVLATIKPTAIKSSEPKPSPSSTEPPSPKPSPPATVKLAGSLACPIDGPTSFTDTYGAPRDGGRSHQGVDMFAAYGTPTVAVTGGVVARKDSSSAGGITVLLRGANGTEYYYAHLSGYAAVSVGQAVSSGQRLGYVGSSGNASANAPHLHFEVHPGGGGPINPYPTAKAACG